MNEQLENPPVILVVNDDQVALELLKDLLEPEGYKVFMAQGAQPALEIVSTVRMDLILCDVVMPGMNGMELCRALKNSPKTADVPVLLVSAVRKEEAALLEGFASGADDYLEIPFRQDALLVKVARLAERHRVEKRYRDLVEHAADIIYTRDMEGRITSINEAGARFFGRPTFDLIGRSLGSLIGKEAAQHDIAEMRKLKSFEPVRFIQSLTNAFGELRYLEGSITFERNAQGQSLGVRGVVRDVTDRTRAELALQKQNEEYRILFDSNPCPMYLCAEPDLKFLAVNDSAVSHYGYSREEFLGMSALDIRPEDERQALINYIGGNSQSHGAAGVWKHRKKDGAVIEVEVNWHKLIFSGRPAYLVSANDVTDQRQAAIAARESEDRYRELFENANDIIYTIDLAGNFTSLNRTGERLTGYSRAEALTMNIAVVVAPDYLDIVKKNLARKLDSNELSTVYEAEIITKSGERRR